MRYTHPLCQHRSTLCPIPQCQHQTRSRFHWHTRLRSLRVLPKRAPDHLSIHRLAHDHRTNQQVFQLTHVPRPGVRQQGFLSVPTQADRGKSLRNQTLEDMTRQQEHITPTLTQCWQTYLKLRETTQELRPKSHTIPQILVRCRHQSHIYCFFFYIPHPPDLFVLQDSQQLRLEVQRHVSDLIQKQRPSRRLMEQPIPLTRP